MGCENASNLPTHSEPQFPHLKNGVPSVINEIKYIKVLCQGQSVLIIIL